MSTATLPSVPLHPVLDEITRRIIERSRETRGVYLERIRRARAESTHRRALSCGNLAHGFAACADTDKARLRGVQTANLGIVTAYNDMLSAHQPYERYPELIRSLARELGHTAQVAGGVPAMCDGVTQGRAGMELSLFSRDVIALSTAIALSHDMFDAVVCLGICDKIVPGMLIGALAYGHLPTLFIPAGPMPSGLPNSEKSRVRQLYAEGKAGREELLEAEAASYHSPGTCTFYGTANSNQMFMEIMGLHLPGSSFVNPNTPLREALTRAAIERVFEITSSAGDYRPIGEIIDERSFVNAVVGLHATGGSTNHLLHLVAMAAAGGIQITWDDFDALSHAVPLLARIYPNGSADVNQFHQAGGMGFIIRELGSAGLLHLDAGTVWGGSLADYAQVPVLDGATLRFAPQPAVSADESVLRPVAAPFRADGGLRLLQGPLGRACIKVSSVQDDRMVVTAPARIFHEQDEVKAAFERGELERDVIVVLRFQGPAANGMPELHKLTPLLTVLQKRGFRVAFVTDGRMSGASGQVPAAIHVTPEAAKGGALARLRDGDVVTVDAINGRLDVAVDPAEFAARELAHIDLEHYHFGFGRELFASFRAAVGPADGGANVLLKA
jgi:phosphogluconate dehydratase